jgi:hypothetical protein
MSLRALACGTAVMAAPMETTRVGLLAGQDRASAGLVGRLVPMAQAILRHAYLGGEFAFTLRPHQAGLRPEGASGRYSLIAALGLRRLPEADQRAVLGGDTCDDLIWVAARRLDDMVDLGEVALACWAAAEAAHGELPHAIDRLRALDPVRQTGGTGLAPARLPVVAAAWIVTALVAARELADVEEHLAAARKRLLAARRDVFPHLTGQGAPWYRAHVGSFADQIYPVQALARLHASDSDQTALEVADHVAGVICQAQGAAGQWWWHYDARCGRVVERYPVYSVHQYGMAPMALLDLAEAGGDGHLAAICAGLRWLSAPPEVSKRLIADEIPVVWRKVARGDPGKAVRGLAAASTAVWPGWQAPRLAADLIFPPRVIDRECRPYEPGWLLYAWLRGAGR